MRLPFALLVSLALLAPVSTAQERQPQRDYMIHMDLSQSPPRYIPDELTLLPGGTVQLMLFGKGSGHSLTLDSAPGYDADVPAGTAEGFYERAAQFQAPQAPGKYAFHDKQSAAVGTLIVRTSGPTEAPIIGVRENGYDLHFAPERLVVSAGDTVTFRANGSFAHTLTSETNAWSDANLALSPGQEATFKAPTAPGEYPFFCKYHKEGGMRGVLVVQASTAAPPPQGSTPAPTPSQAIDEKRTAAPAFALLALGVSISLVILARTKR